jgi:hypothetical protein
MNIAMFFRRPTAQRPTRTTRKPQPAQLLRDWTVRDWADLPPHHPRHD